MAVWWVLGGLFAYMLAILLLEHRWMRQHVPEAGEDVPVSVIRPVRGVDPGAWETHRSLFQQEHSRYEVIFSLQDPDDPALPILRRVMEEHPRVPARIVINPVAPGLSGKSSNLIHGLAAARHEIAVFSDADILFDDPRLLKKLVKQLDDERVGAVCLAPVGVNPKSFWARVFQAYQLAFGAQTLSLAVTSKNPAIGLAGGTFAARKGAIEAIGGFAPYGDYAAEDMAIGQALTRAGYVVRWIPRALTPLGGMSLREAYNVMKRWTLAGAKGFGPLWHLGYVMSYGYIWGVLAGLAFAPAALAPSLAYGGLRLAVAFIAAAGPFREMGALPQAPLLPLADAFMAILLPAALIHPVIEWRGIRCRVGRGGRMSPIAAG